MKTENVTVGFVEIVEKCVDEAAQIYNAIVPIINAAKDVDAAYGALAQLVVQVGGRAGLEPPLLLAGVAVQLAQLCKGVSAADLCAMAHHVLLATEAADAAGNGPNTVLS